MSLLAALGLFGAGLGLVVVSAEELVESTVGVSRGLGGAAFAVSVVLIGFDPENLVVGAVASVEGSSGIALGTIVGAAMVALALALGVTALVAPLSFEQVPGRLAVLPVGAVGLLLGLGGDGTLSRVDGGLLLLAYLGAVGLLVRWEQQGIRVTPEAGMEADEDVPRGWQAGAWFGASMVGVVVGSEMLLRGARPFIEALEWTDTLFGMTVLALLVSVEEVARELPAAMKGRPDISIGNVVGSALAFFCFNAGVIALLRPIPVGATTRSFYLPVARGTVLVIAFCLLRRRVSRWAGALLLLLYGIFVVGPFLG